MLRRLWEETLKINRKVNRRLEEIRRNNELIHQNRLREVYRAIPRVEEIVNQKKIIGYKLVKAVIHSKDILGELETESKALDSEKDKLLLSNGYPVDYLEPIYSCSICKDTGVVETSYCSCKKRMITEELYAISGIDKVIQVENFKNFDLKLFRANRNQSETLSPREMMKIYLDDALNYVNNFPYNKNKNRIYYGPVGTGKTYLCNCIAKGLLDNGYLVVYQTATKLMNFISDYNFSRAEDKGILISRYELLRDCDLLIIDDLGTEISTSINTTHLFELINDRIIKEKATIISTNLNLENIRDDYDDRIFSRILGEYEVFNVFGDDLRIKKFSGI